MFIVFSPRGGKVKTVTASGVPNVTSEDQSGIPAAVQMAKSADTVVLLANSSMSRNAIQRESKAARKGKNSVAHKGKIGQPNRALNGAL